MKVINPFIVEIHKLMIYKKVNITFRMAEDSHDESNLLKWNNFAALFLKMAYIEVLEKKFPDVKLDVSFKTVKSHFLPWIQLILRQVVFFMSVCHGLVLIWFLGWERAKKIDEAIVMLGGCHSAYILAWYLKAAIQSLVLSLLYGIIFYIIMFLMSTPLAFWELQVVIFIFYNFVTASLITACLLLRNVKLSLSVSAIYHATLYYVVISNSEFENTTTHFFIPHTVFRCPCPGLLCGPDSGASFGSIFSCFKYHMICYFLLVLCGSLTVFKHDVWKQLLEYFPAMLCTNQAKEKNWKVFNEPFHDEEIILKIKPDVAMKSFLPKDYTFLIPFMKATVLLDPLLGKRTPSLLRNIIGREAFANEMIMADMKLVESLICLCPSYDFLFAQLTVKETMTIFNKFVAKSNVMRPLENDLKTILEDFNLTHKDNVLVRNLCQNDRKIVMLAIAFLSSANLLLLDNPTGSLSEHSLKLAINNIQRRKHQTTMILTCNSGDDALRIADRVAVICNNRIRIYGTVFFVTEYLGVGTHVQVAKSKDSIKRLYLYLWLFAPNIKCQSQLYYDIDPNTICVKFFVPKVDLSNVQYIVTNLRYRSDTFGIIGMEVSDIGIDEVLDRCKNPMLLEAVLYTHSTSIPIIHNIKSDQFYQLQQWLAKKDRYIRFSQIKDFPKNRQVPSLSSSATQVTSSSRALPVMSEMSLKDFLKSSKRFHVGKTSSYDLLGDYDSQNQNTNRQKKFHALDVTENVFDPDAIDRSSGKEERIDENDHYPKITKKCTYSNKWIFHSQNMSPFTSSEFVHLPNKVHHKEELLGPENKGTKKLLNSNLRYLNTSQSTSQRDKNTFDMMEMGDKVLSALHSNVNNNSTYTSFKEDDNIQIKYYNMVMNGVVKEDVLYETKRYARSASTRSSADKSFKDPDAWIILIRNHTKAIFNMLLLQYWNCLIFIIVGFLASLTMMNFFCFVKINERDFLMENTRIVDLEKSITRNADVRLYHPSDLHLTKTSRLSKMYYQSNMKDFVKFSPIDVSGVPRGFNIISIGATFNKTSSKIIYAQLYYTQERGDAMLLSIIKAMDSIQDYLTAQSKEMNKTSMDFSLNYMPMKDVQRLKFILEETRDLSVKIAIALNISSCILVFSIIFGSLCDEMKSFYDLLNLSGVNRVLFYGIEVSIQVLLYASLMTIVLLAPILKSPVGQLDISSIVALLTGVPFLYALAVFTQTTLVKRTFGWKKMLCVWLLVEGSALCLWCLDTVFTLSRCEQSVLMMFARILSPLGCQTSTFLYVLQYYLWQVVMSRVPQTEYIDSTSFPCLTSVGHQLVICLLCYFMQSALYFIICFIFEFWLPIWKWIGTGTVNSNGQLVWRLSLSSLFSFKVPKEKEGYIDLIDVNLTKPVLKNPKRITASVGPCECMVIFGSGKASGSCQFIRCILGLDDLKHGKIRFQADKLRNHLLQSSRHLEIGYCPPENNLNPRLTGQQILKLFASIRNVTSDLNGTVNSMLSAMSLTTVADHLTYKYSDDDKRKLHVAMALIGNPKFLILDYPTDGLDLLMKSQIWRNIDEYRQNGNTVIVSTNCPEEALFLGTSSVILCSDSSLVKMNFQEIKDQTKGYFAYIWLRMSPLGTSTPIVTVIRFLQRRFHSGVFAMVNDVRDPYIILSFVNAHHLDHALIYDTCDELRETEIIRAFVVKEATEMNVLNALLYEWLPY